MDDLKFFFVFEFRTGLKQHTLLIKKCCKNIWQPENVTNEQQQKQKYFRGKTSYCLYRQVFLSSVVPHVSAHLLATIKTKTTFKLKSVAHSIRF